MVKRRQPSMLGRMIAIACVIGLMQMGHASLAQMEHYAKLAERFVFGEAREVQREILMIFCPGLSDQIIDCLLPDRTSFFETFQSGSLRRRRTVVPIEDVLFDGAAYEIDLPEIERELTGFLETF